MLYVLDQVGLCNWLKHIQEAVATETQMSFDETTSSELFSTTNKVKRRRRSRKTEEVREWEEED